ncbi:MAG: hypothetical protein AB7F59_12210 [Bdellovibrionales bacterium]
MIFFLVFVTTGAYFLLMIFYPEWVGITGRSAKKTLEEHQEGSAAPTDETDYLKKH